MQIQQMCAPHLTIVHKQDYKLCKEYKYTPTTHVITPYSLLDGDVALRASLDTIALVPDPFFCSSVLRLWILVQTVLITGDAFVGFVVASRAYSGEARRAL